MFDEMSVFRVTFLMKLRSGGLLFREKGPMGDLRVPWGARGSQSQCPAGGVVTVGSPSGLPGDRGLPPFWDRKSMFSRLIFVYVF